MQEVQANLLPKNSFVTDVQPCGNAFHFNLFCEVFAPMISIGRKGTVIGVLYCTCLTGLFDLMVLKMFLEVLHEKYHTSTIL